MLGWELSPHITGGLGVASASLARSLSRQGTDVLFLVPRARGDERVGASRVRGCGPVAERGELAAVGAGEVDSELRPYLTRAAYAERRAAAERGSAGAARAFAGGYGESLFDEVTRFATEVEGLCVGESFDVVHAHDWMTFAAGRRAKERTGRPLICHVHSSERDRRPFDPDPEIMAQEQRAFDVADRVVCVSEFACETLQAHYRVDPEKVRTVHNAVELRDGADAGRAARGRPPRALFLGRLTDQKGPLTFVEAAARVLDRMPEAEAVVCGEGELREACEERARALGVGDRVRFPGFLRGAAVQEMYASSDVFVLPSVSEPFGLTPLEAIAAGTPALVSRRSGAAEILKSALQFDPRDVEDLAEKMLAVMRFPSLRDQLVAAGRAELRGQGWDASALLLRRVYEEVVA